ncbi:MAG TPA: anti-sigma factor [Gaiellaceae bacterium]
MAVHDLTAAYALDALAGEERERYETHLAQCERCRDELASLAPAATALAYAVDAPPPSPELRERVLHAARTDNVVALPRRRAWASTSVAAAAACVAAAAVVWAVSLSHSLSDTRAQRDASARAVAILGDPATVTHRLKGANGVVGVDSTGRGVIVVRGLGHAPHGKTYEAWVIGGGAPLPAGTFAGGARTTVVQLTVPVPRGAVVAATVERAGGVAKPTTTPFTSATT